MQRKNQTDNSNSHPAKKMKLNGTTSSSRQEVDLYWFRQDLRLSDNVPLTNFAASSSSIAFIYIRNYAVKVPPANPNQVSFFDSILASLSLELRNHGYELYVFDANDFPKINESGSAVSVFEAINLQVSIRKIATNANLYGDVNEVQKWARSNNIPFILENDAILFSNREGDPTYVKTFRKFGSFNKAVLEAHLTPLAKLKKKGQEGYLTTLVNPSLPSNTLCLANLQNLTYTTSISAEPINILSKIDSHLSRYMKSNNKFLQGSKISKYVIPGCVSMKYLLKRSYDILAPRGNEVHDRFVRSLVWRDHYLRLGMEFGKVTTPGADYLANLPWKSGRVADSYYEAWCNGRTGYEIIDASMNELNSTGFMNNQSRMMVACFLVKNLHLNWRRGEEYFARLLTDFDPVVNYYNWSWVVGCAVDAQPYFRAFNPDLQIKHDIDKQFLNRWLPYDIRSKPPRIVDYSASKEEYMNLAKSGKK
jgi:deoxyribodipyrimidine photo-lyase